MPSRYASYALGVGAALVIAVALPGCGGTKASIAASHSTTTTPTVSAVKKILRQAGYAPIGQTPISSGGATATIPFRLEPSFGQVVGVYRKDGLIVSVIRPGKSAAKPNIAGAYWFRAGEVALLGFSVPPHQPHAGEDFKSLVAEATSPS